MKTFSRRLWRLTLQAIALGALILFLIIPGSFLGLAALAILAEVAAIALELFGLHSIAFFVRTTRTHVQKCAHRCAKNFRRRAVATAIGTWWYLRTLYLLHRRAP